MASYAAGNVFHPAPTEAAKATHETAEATATANQSMTGQEEERGPEEVEDAEDDQAEKMV